MVALKFLLFFLIVGICQSTSPPLIMLSTVLQEPFITPASDSDARWGYKGILIDLVSHFVKNAPGALQFANVKFTVHEKYGRKVNGTWIGLIGEMANSSSSSMYGVGPISITADRMDAVKFSMPFFTTGMSAVGKAITFPVIQENLPKILKMAEEDKITVGVMQSGSSEEFFKTTEIEIYKKIYEQMKKNTENFVLNYAEGFAKVRSSPVEKPFIFFGEKALMDYYTGKAPCDLKVLTCNTLNTVHFGLVFKKDASEELVHRKNQEIIDFLASGKMESWKNKWYNNECKNNQTVTV